MLRARVAGPSWRRRSRYHAPEDVSWILRGDRAITWQQDMPRGSKIVDGEWWEDDYQGPPLISISKEAFDEFGLSLGDTVTINVLGRTITATIANAREVEWESFSINFVFILSPGILEKAPHSWIATTYADNEDAIDKIETQVTDAFSECLCHICKRSGGSGDQYSRFTWRRYSPNRLGHIDIWHCRAGWHSCKL